MKNRLFWVSGLLGVLVIGHSPVAHGESTRRYKAPSPEQMVEFKKDVKKYRKYLMESVLADQIDSANLAMLYVSTNDVLSNVTSQYDAVMRDREASDAKKAKLKALTEWYTSQVTLLQEMSRILHALELNDRRGSPTVKQQLHDEYEKSYQIKLAAYRSLLMNPPS